MRTEMLITNAFCRFGAMFELITVDSMGLLRRDFSLAFELDFPHRRSFGIQLNFHFALNQKCDL